MARNKYQNMSEIEYFRALQKDVPEMIRGMRTSDFCHVIEKHHNRKQEEMRTLCIGDRTDKGSFYGRRDVLLEELKKILLKHTDKIIDMLVYLERDITISQPIPEDFPLYTNVYRYGRGHDWRKGPLQANELRIILARDMLQKGNFFVITAFPCVMGDQPYVYDRPKKTGTD